jgi:hypothetical protein
MNDSYELQGNHLVLVVTEPPIVWRPRIALLISDPWTNMKFTLANLFYDKDNSEYTFLFINGSSIKTEDLNLIHVEVKE